MTDNALLGARDRASYVSMRKSWRGLLDRFRIAPPSRFAGVLLVQPKYVWGGLLLPAFLIVECVAMSVNNGRPLASAFKVAGFLIGLSGLTLVAVGLSRTRRLFRKSSLLDRIQRWMRNVLGLIVKRPPIVLSGDAVIMDFTADASLIRGSVQGKTLEERIAALERRASEAEKQIDEVRRDARRAVDEVRREFRSDADRIRASVTSVEKRLEDFSVGGLDLEGMGLVWLIVGSVLSTFHEGIAEWPMWRVFVE